MYNRRDVFKLGSIMLLPALVGCGDSSEVNLTNLINSGLVKMSGVSSSSVTIKSGKTVLGKPKANVVGTIAYEDNIGNLEDAHRRSIKYIANTVSSYLKSDKGTIEVEGTAKNNKINTSDWASGSTLTISKAKELGK